MRQSLFFAFLVGISCSTKISNDSEFQYGSKNFHFIENRYFDLDSVSSYEFYYFDHGIVENEEFLFVVNLVNSSVDIYSLEHESLKSRFPIPRQGPGYIDKPQGILFHTPDSIFVFPSMMMSNISLFNLEGKLYHHLKVKQATSSKFDMVVNHASLPSIPTIYHQKKLIFSNLTLGNSSGNPDFFNQYQPNFVVDLENDSLNWETEFKYPRDFFGKYWPSSLVNNSTVKNKQNQLVSSWSGLDYLIIKDLEGREIDQIQAQTQFAKVYEFGGAPLSGEEERLIFLEHHSYIQLLYDEFRDLYYRIAKLPRKRSTGEYLDHTSSYKNDFSVLILDKDFKLLEEVRFPGGIHHPYLAFVGRKGLYLSRTNPYNPELNENRISFDVYGFEKD
jgi:hypothetical protein